jgi:superfamily II RNA helicase
MMKLKDKLNGNIKPTPKLKKDILKQISNLNDKIKNDSNLDLYKKKYELEISLLKMTDNIDVLNNIYSNQFDILIDFLDSLNLNEIDRKIMTMVNDINPLIILNLVKMIDDLSFEEIVSVVSLLVDDTNMEWYRLDDNLKINIEKEMRKEYLDIIIKLEKKVIEIFSLENKLNNKLLIKNNNENVFGYNNFYQSYLWAKGCKYVDIKNYNMYDGNFIKNILRNVNIIRNLVSIFTYLKNTNLLNKLYGFEEKLIRDIVTVDSLYL